MNKKLIDLGQGMKVYIYCPKKSTKEEDKKQAQRKLVQFLSGEISNLK